MIIKVIRNTANPFAAYKIMLRRVELKNSIEQSKKDIATRENALRKKEQELKELEEAEK